MPIPVKLSGSKRDLLYAGVALIPLTAVASFFDTHGVLGEWAALFQALLVALAVVFAWYAWRRWREYRQEVELRRVSEASLTQNQGRLMDLLEASGNRFYETDDQFRIVWRSRAGLPMTEDTGRYLGKTRWEAVGGDPKTDKRWAVLYNDMVSHRPFRNFRETRAMRGEIAHRLLNGRPFYSVDGKFLGYRCTVTDITKEVEAQAEAARIQARFLDAIESIADGYALWDHTNSLVTCNDRYMRPSGRQKILLRPGLTFADFASNLANADNTRRGSEPSDDWVQTAIANHNSKTMMTSQQVAFNERWLEIINHHLVDGSTLSITRDITAQKELEQQLQRSQKLKAVGQLTGGIAHDFNNLLQVILGNIELILEQAKPDGKVTAQAKIAQMASQRGADLIRRLMAFSRQQTLQPRAFDINDMVAEMGEIIKRTLGKDIDFRTQLGQRISPVYLDRGQAEAAFLNLAVNARDAMPKGGTLFVETQELTFNSDDLGDHFELAPGRYVVLTISDTGTGMSPDVLARAFEPFFTTKAIGKGTGLGLSTIYGFLKQSGGDVKIYSEIGSGTAVKLYLPTADASQPSDTAPAEQAPILTGTETVLVVEDEEAVRLYTVQQLENLGYRVFSASDGKAALEQLERLEGTVDLLFTDIIMPSMNGHQLTDYVTALYPAVKILYTSGYSQNVAPSAIKPKGRIGMIEKPYRKADLARKVREVLDSDSLNRS